MINQKVEEAINKQINEELFSAYLYLSMATHFDAVNLPGFAGWMKAQAQEEVSHAMRFYHYLGERGGRAVLQPIKGPQTEWQSPLAAFQDALKHEEYITSCIHKLVDLAAAEKDHATANMLQWFVAEQVEEEATASEILEKLKMIGDQGHAVYMMDRELGARKAG
jgi:ferritin